MKLLLEFAGVDRRQLEETGQGLDWRYPEMVLEPLGSNSAPQ